MTGRDCWRGVRSGQGFCWLPSPPPLWRHAQGISGRLSSSCLRTLTFSWKVQPSRLLVSCPSPSFLSSMENIPQQRKIKHSLDPGGENLTASRQAHHCCMSWIMLFLRKVHRSLYEYFTIISQRREFSSRTKRFLSAKGGFPGLAMGKTDLKWNHMWTRSSDFWPLQMIFGTQPDSSGNFSRQNRGKDFGWGWSFSIQGGDVVPEFFGAAHKKEVPGPGVDSCCSFYLVAWVAFFAQNSKMDSNNRTNTDHTSQNFWFVKYTYNSGSLWLPKIQNKNSTKNLFCLLLWNMKQFWIFVSFVLM